MQTMMSTLARPGPARPLTVLLVLLALDTGGAKAQNTSGNVCPPEFGGGIIPDFCPCFEAGLFGSDCKGGSFCCTPEGGELTPYPRRRGGSPRTHAIWRFKRAPRNGVFETAVSKTAVF